MTHFTFYVDPNRLVLRLQLGDEPDGADPAVASTVHSELGWLVQLAEQANRLDPPPAYMMDTTQVTLWDSRNPNDRFEQLLGAARNLLAVWDEECEASLDLAESLSFQVLALADAVKAWEKDA